MKKSNMKKSCSFALMAIGVSICVSAFARPTISSIDDAWFDSEGGLCVEVTLSGVENSDYCLEGRFYEFNSEERSLLNGKTTLTRAEIKEKIGRWGDWLAIWGFEINGNGKYSFLASKACGTRKDAGRKYSDVYPNNCIGIALQIDSVYTDVVLWPTTNGSSGTTIAPNLFVLAGGFDGSIKHTFNGLVYDADGNMCGMAQITTAKNTMKGVKIGGFIMLADGKKQTVKSVSGTFGDGYLTATTSVSKLGNMAITIGGNGFKGTVGNMTIATENTDDDTGILSGKLKLSYFDAKTGKIKTKNITIGGVASGGEATGTAAPNGKNAKSFAAEIK